MKAFTLAVLVCGLFGVAGHAAAQGVDARRLPELKHGESLSIVDEDGRRIDGRFVDLSADTITVRRRRGPEQIRIDRVVRIEKPDSLANGAWVGFGVGAGMGMLGAISAGVTTFRSWRPSSSPTRSSPRPAASASMRSSTTAGRSISATVGWSPESRRSLRLEFEAPPSRAMVRKSACATRPQSVRAMPSASPDDSVPEPSAAG